MVISRERGCRSWLVLLLLLLLCGAQWSFYPKIRDGCFNGGEILSIHRVVLSLCRRRLPSSRDTKTRFVVGSRCRLRRRQRSRQKKSTPTKDRRQSRRRRSATRSGASGSATVRVFLSLSLSRLRSCCCCPECSVFRRKTRVRSLVLVVLKS